MAETRLIKIAALPLGRSEVLRVAIDGREGATFIDVRVCTHLAVGTGILAPTKRGLSIPPGLLLELIRALKTAQAELGLADD